MFFFFFTVVVVLSRSAQAQTLAGMKTTRNALFLFVFVDR